jgi:hypothetical protein
MAKKTYCVYATRQIEGKDIDEWTKDGNGSFDIYDAGPLKRRRKSTKTPHDGTNGQ